MRDESELHFCVSLCALNGCSLSLMLLRRLAALLHGDLHVTDRRDGVRGVVYRLRLPCVAAPDPDADAVVATVTPVLPRSLLRTSVLIVDDSEGNRRLARRMLLQLGCFVVEAADGDEVVRALAAAAAAAAAGPGATPGATRGVDVVLMDIEMPRMDGVAALAEMRAHGWGAPVIVTVISLATPTRRLQQHVWCSAACAAVGRARTLTERMTCHSLRFPLADVARGFCRVLPKPFSREQLRADVGGVP